MKHYMDISRIRTDDESEFSYDNTKGFEVGDHIQISEKIDGANSSIALDENGNLVAFSRKNELSATNHLRGFWNFVQTLDKNQFADLGNMILFGEWLVPHTVKYLPESYNQWYVYDLYDKDTDQWLPQTKVKAFAEAHGLNYIHVLYDGPFISWEHCRTFLNNPVYGDAAEGEVVKNQSKLNDPDIRSPFYLKIVNETFKETQLKNHVKKVLDPQHEADKKSAEEDAEKVVTEARVRKDINKMIDEGILPEQISPKDMGLIARNLPKRIFEDIMKEESNSIDISNQFIGKAINNRVMVLARTIVLGG